MREINVAIVGCGFVAYDHLRAWKKVKEARVISVCDLNETTAKKTAELWRIPHYCTSFSELIKHGDLNLIDICTPPQTHASLAVQAMEAGFHVLLEKPMAITIEDAEKIISVKKTTGMKLGVIHNWLFEPPVLEASAVLKKGHLGEVISAEVEVLCTKDDPMAANEHHWCHNLPGGRFSEMLAHPIYLLQHFLGGLELEGVWVSKVGEYSWMKADELCSIFKAGEKWARAYVSFNAPRQAIFINIYGSEAILRLDIINATMIRLPHIKIKRFNKGIDSMRQASQLIVSTVRNAVNVMLGRWKSGHEMYIRLFAESLISNKEPPVTPYEAYETVKILEQICRKIG